MKLSVLNVAYPLAPVGLNTTGGAEQVLSLIDAALVRDGHTSAVIACEGSEVAGALIPIPRTEGTLDEAAQERVRQELHATLLAVLEQIRFDVIHMHGVDFHTYLPPAGNRVLATLHLPPSWYPEAIFRSNVWLQPVSRSQAAACPSSELLLQPIANGVPIESFQTHVRKRDFALALGRVCPEKGLHLAARAARDAQCPLAIAGELFPYPAHQNYFHSVLSPVLDHARRFIGPVGLARKRRLLAAARCVLISSLVPETSSLVAMEALACGTPVIAFRTGALPEIIDHGRTGFLVSNAREMAAAISQVHTIDPEACRTTARERFDAHGMTAEYLRLYRRLSQLAATEAA